MVDNVSEHLQKLKKYYDDNAPVYESTYSGEGRYPSNFHRLNIVLGLLSKISPRPERILEAGCGDARVVHATLENGYDTVGIDFSEVMIRNGKRILENGGYSPDRIEIGNIYELPYGSHKFDSVLCLGVIENLPNHEVIFAEFRRVLKPGGQLIISLDNDLFSMFSMNKHSLIFYKKLFNDIGLDGETQQSVLGDIARWMNIDDIEVVPKLFQDTDVDKSDVIIPNYNPISVTDVLGANAFRVTQLRFFHYHPLPPRFEKAYPELFDTFAQNLEGVNFDWRGAILCNAMLVQAGRIE